MNMKVFNKTLNGLLKNKMVLYGLIAAVVALLVIGGLVLMKKRKSREGFKTDSVATYTDTVENVSTTTSLTTDTSMDSSMETNTEPSMDSSMETNTDSSMETNTDPESPTIEWCSKMGCYGPK